LKFQIVAPPNTPNWLGSKDVVITAGNVASDPSQIQVVADQPYITNVSPIRFSPKDVVYHHRGLLLPAWRHDADPYRDRCYRQQLGHASLQWDQCVMPH
jgi:hypothetical protein